MAAQTARDRKKALMTELEEKVAQLQDHNKQLMKENAQLRLHSSTLKEENNQLKKRLIDKSNTTACEMKDTDALALSCKREPESHGSAVPAVSLPKEQIQALSRLMMHFAACALTMRYACS